MLLQTNPVFSRLSFSIIRKSIVWHLFVIYLFLSLQLSPGCRLGGVPVAGCGSPRQYLDHDQTYKKKNTQPNIDSEVKSLFPCVLPVLGPLRFVCVYVCTAGIVWILKSKWVAVPGTRSQWTIIRPLRACSHTKNGNLCWGQIERYTATLTIDWDNLWLCPNLSLLWLCNQSYFIARIQNNST